MEKYLTSDLVKIAKRDNNKKRPYLLVNPLQGKHIPVKPSESLKLFKELSDKLLSRYKDEKFLIIGFAETATAIGAALACAMPRGAYYIQTTRETGLAEYICFSEDHSHAAEQKLAKTGLKEIIETADRVIFAEDEVTTGNTILNLMSSLKNEYPESPLKFGIASIINGMSEDVISCFSEEGIECDYILRFEQKDFSADLSRHIYPDEYRFPLNADIMGEIEKQGFRGRLDPRKALKSGDYAGHIHEFAAAVLKGFDLANKSVLVLGSEEFMYPPMLCAYELEKNAGCMGVWFHATTRSPILPGSGCDYPLFSRFELRSLYDPERITYIYNLKKYDKVIIIHDAQTPTPIGVKSLVSALLRAGNKDISIIGWSD